MEATPDATHKALSINLDAQKFGVFAEIGAGQEVVRWFFHSGKASATVAKSISAYDMSVSDDLYGPTAHYVSRERLESMLDREYTQLLTRLDQTRGDKTAFFVFADTAATHSPHRSGGHGWLGVRFQTQPRSEPSQIVAHVQLLDPAAADEHEALGIVGVNLIYGAFSFHQDPSSLLRSLPDGLHPGRVEVDMIKFSGPAFAGVDNRLMSLQLVEQGLTDAAIFTAHGEVIQGSEVLSGKPVVIGRGAFRPVTNVMKEMLDAALSQYHNGPGANAGDPIVVLEMTLSNLMAEHPIDHADFLARVDMLNALGRMVMISNYTRFDRVTSYLRKYTRNWIVMVMGAPTLNEIFNEKYYADLDGGILEGLGALFQGNVKLYSLGTVAVPPESQRLYQDLLEKGRIEPIRQFDSAQFNVYPREVLAKIQAGLPDWETMVPGPVAQLIKDRKLFGYAGGVV
jgi:hypothetical protein